MKFKAHIDCNTDAFGENDRAHEVAQILRDLADQIESGLLLVYLSDSQRNSVGIAGFSDSQ